MEMIISAEGWVTALTLPLLTPDSPENQATYREFLERHGGRLTVLRRKGGQAYRLELPAGTTQQSKQESGLPLHKCFELVLPDGARLIWFSGIKLDDHEVGAILLTSFEPGKAARLAERDEVGLRSLL